MKVFESPLKLVPDTQLVAQFQKEYTLQLSLNKQPGLILWAVYLDDMSAKRVEIRSMPLMTTKGKVTGINKATFDPKATYVWAINEYRALYKVDRDFKEFIRKSQERKLSS